MSWLSDLIYGTSPSDEDRRQQAAMQQYLSAQQSQQSADAAALQKQQLDAILQATGPTEYDKRLQQYQIENLDTESQQNQMRRAALAQLGGTFSPEFERSYLPSTYDDPYIAQAYTTQRAKVDDYLNNLLKRGVITQTGYQGGEAAAEEQAPGVRAQLSDLGNTLLEAERGKLTDIGNRAKGTASTLDIGQTFDPSVYGQELSQATQDIGSEFGDLYSSKIPSGLFDLTSLASKAGAAQGAQNLAFDPNAVAGATETDLPTDETTPAKKRASTVF